MNALYPTMSQLRKSYVFYSPRYVGSHYAFDTTRKAQWLAASLQTAPIPGIILQEPLPVEEQQVAALHDPQYVRAIITGLPRVLAESQGFPWDAELWPMVAMATGGVLAAATAARETGSAGSLSSGLHHARAAHGAGFCTVNGLALAAKAARAAGAQAVLILDLDAHCGGGTASLIADDPHIWQLDIATDRFDSYRPRAGTTLDIIRDAATLCRLLRSSVPIF